MKRCVLTYCLLILLGCIVLPANAQYKSAAKNSVRHFVGFSLGGGLATNLYNTSLVDNQAGAAANFKLNYEIHKSKWIFGIGVEANYQYLRDTVADFMDAKMWRDRDGDDCSYQYVYQGFREMDHAFGIGIPLQLGRVFGDHVYAMVGARFYLPIYTQSNSRTRLLTQGDYSWNITPVRTEGINDYSIYGFYANDEYTYSYSYAESMRAGAWLEVGGYIPLKKSKKTRLRVGAYFDYEQRFGTKSRNRLADYKKIDMSPTTMSQDNLRANIRWNAINTTELLTDLPGNMEAGVRMTLLIDVTPQNIPCMCDSSY